MNQASPRSGSLGHGAFGAFGCGLLGLAHCWFC